jgi:hypothetical protein
MDDSLNSRFVEVLKKYIQSFKYFYYYLLLFVIILSTQANQNWYYKLEIMISNHDIWLKIKNPRTNEMTCWCFPANDKEQTKWLVDTFQQMTNVQT